MLAHLKTWGDRALRAAAALMLFSLLACVVLGVISRALNAPLSWTDELAQYLLVWCGFTGWVLASRSRSHIRITTFAERLPKPARRVLEAATQLAVAALGAGLIAYSFGLIGRNLDVESISVPLPAAVLYMPLPLLGLALILQALAELYEALTARRLAISGGQVL